MYLHRVPFLAIEIRHLLQIHSKGRRQHACWLPGDARSQCISGHDIDPISMKCAGKIKLKITLCICKRPHVLLAYPRPKHPSIFVTFDATYFRALTPSIHSEPRFIIPFHCTGLGISITMSLWKIPGKSVSNLTATLRRYEACDS